MTFTLTEVLMILVAFAVAVFVGIFARLSFQLNKTASEMEETARRARDLVPATRSLLEQAESDLRDVRDLTRRTTKIAEDVQAVTGEASALTVQVLQALEGPVSDRARAAVVGARAGFEALRHGRGAEASRTNGSGRDAADV